MDSGYSYGDIRAIADGNGGMMGGGFMWFIVLALLFGGGFGGFGGRAATQEDVASGFNFAGVNGKLNELVAGQANINQNLGNAICTSTYELASKIDACCCSTKEAIGQVRYDMAVQNSELKAMMQQNKIEGLQAQVNQLQLAQAMCGVPKINPYGYGVYAYPSCASFNSCTNI